MHMNIKDRFDPRAALDAVELARALDENLSGTGPAVARYEAALAKAFGAVEAVTISSGSSAVLVALAALGVEPGDEVILTPTCPLCTVYPLLALRVIPVFCDTQRDNFGLDLNRTDRLVTARTRAVIDIPMWGYPLDGAAGAAFARRHGLPYMLDLAHGHAIELHGRLLWQQAVIATFSTHASKIMVTGEGGFILTNRPELAERARLYARFGNLTGVHFGMNHKLGGLQAALGLARLPALFTHVATRRQTMSTIAQRLDNRWIEPLPILPGGVPNGLALLVRERAGNGAALVAHLEANGIPSDIRRYGCKPLYQFEILAHCVAKCPNAEALLGSITTIPVHQDLEPTQVDHIVSALNNYSGAT